MRNTKTAIASTLLSAFLLAACTTPVGQQASGIDVQPFWARLTGSAASPAPEKRDAPLAASPDAQVEHDWWKHFGDETLNALITEALANNKTLGIAKARVEEARASRSVARSRLFPEVVGSASASRGDSGAISNDRTIGIAEANIEASWELDLFGRNQALTAEATAILESEEASAQAVRIELLAEVARNYFDMRNFERQIVLTQPNLATQQRTLELTQAQLRGG